jgi:hypothetical protein
VEVDDDLEFLTSIFVEMRMISKLWDGAFKTCRHTFFFLQYTSFAMTFLLNNMMRVSLLMYDVLIARL